MSYAKYERYKDSGEAWIGEIPSEWEVIKLKNIFYEKKHTRNMSLNCGSISFGQVICKDDDKVPEATKMAYQEVLNGEFLINPLNLNYDLISLRIALSKIDVVVSAGYIVLKNKIEINKEFFKYLLHRYDVAYMKLLGSGVRQTINFNHIANSLLVLPTDIEQTKIANFLDQKTAQIDQAIALKQQQIEKLGEYKQIVIQNAVTKGLNPNAKMKNSGVEWIGDIPEHWEVKKLKYLIDSKAGYAFPSQQFSQEGISVIRISELNINGSVDISNSPKLPFSFAKFLEEFCVVSGDILMAMTGGTIGKVSIYRESKKSLLNQRVCKFIVKASLDKKLFWHFCNSLYWKNYIDFKANGGAQPNISDNEIKKMYFPLPSISEQKTIANFLDEKTQNINQTIERYQTQIDRLKEYKNILINQAVTGKIKI